MGALSHSYVGSTSVLPDTVRTGTVLKKNHNFINFGFVHIVVLIVLSSDFGFPLFCTIRIDMGIP